MRKIFEFKVFDILNDKENEKFLDKVKKENPDLYNKFLNIIGNKGLNIAKDKYKDFEPEYVKKQRDIEKKKNREKIAEDNKNKVLEENKKLIEEIENVMFDVDVDEIEHKIYSDKNIKNYLDSCHAKIYRENIFNKTLKKSATSISYELRNTLITLERISYKVHNIYSYFGPDFTSIITLKHLFNTKEKKSYFDINVNLYDEKILSVDSDKEEDYLIERCRYVSKNINKYYISKKDIFESITKLSKILSDDVYKEWILRKDAEKYNL